MSPYQKRHQPLTPDTSLPVDVNLSWTGVGDPFITKDRFHQTFPGFKVLTRFDGTDRRVGARLLNLLEG
jgi:hypothetical protein